MNDKLNIQHNPHPKMRYEITLTIQDAPGPFDSITGFMLYQVENKQCSPEDPISGTYGHRPSKHVPIEFTRTSDNTYTGTVYLDLLQNADYFGLGVCHWKMAAAVVLLKAGEVTFSPDISLNKITIQQSEIRYFSKKAYGDTSIKDQHDIGAPMSEIITRYRDEFFFTTLIAKESFQ